ncbi:DUF4905 domain-containing protein [Ekhidna sp.]|uniref:DUF4905 domain-containing protein n=1 Tax=Ekhidna sp. TaxID=2608089 RepID=UPI003B51034D
MIPKSVKHIEIDHQIWSTVVHEEDNCLFLETRNEEDKEVMVSKLELKTMMISGSTLKVDWWSKLIGTVGDELHFIEYQDRNDPTQHSFFSIDYTSGQKKPLDHLPEPMVQSAYPEIYEHGSDYFKTVAEFLSLELPLSCEYMEWKDKIIISYYLRSDNGFERFLLLIKNDEKIWKIQQDKDMKGFSSGAFFVFQDQLIFIKDRNEVCVYTD